MPTPKKIASKKAAEKVAKKHIDELANPEIRIIEPLTLFGLTQSEAMDVLLEKQRSWNGKEESPWSALLTDATTAKGSFLGYIAATRGRMHTLWDAAGFVDFSFEELSTKASWR